MNMCRLALKVSPLAGPEKRKNLEFKSDCESVGDNFEFIRSNTPTVTSKTKQKMSFCWTDNRLRTLVKEYWGYLQSEADNECDLSFNTRCLEKLKTVFDEKPTVYEISEKLKDIAAAYRIKDECELRYRMLKEILGNDRKTYRQLVKHEKFVHFYPNTTSKRVRIATTDQMSSSPSTALPFQWTDDKLQLLVGGYHTYLQKSLSDVNSTPRKCLAFLKNCVGGDVTVQSLRAKLNWIYSARTEQLGNSYDHLKERLGPLGHNILDSLFNKYDFNYCMNASATSSKSRSGGTSSRCQTSSDARCMSSGRMARNDLDQQIDDMRKELKKLDFDNDTLVRAMVEFCDETKRKIFLTIEDELKRQFVLQCIKK